MLTLLLPKPEVVPFTDLVNTNCIFLLRIVGVQSCPKIDVDAHMHDEDIPEQKIWSDNNPFSPQNVIPALCDQRHFRFSPIALSRIFDQIDL